MEQQVAEIARVQGSEPILISGVQLLAPAIGERLGLRRADLGRRQATILPLIDPALAGAPVAGAAAFGSSRLGSDFDNDELLRIGAVRALRDVFTISAHG